jgi:hypothetical protein
MKLPLLILFSSCIISFISARAEKNDSTNVPVSGFKGSFSYLTNAVYYGRHDTLPVPYLTPAIGYYFKSGLYFDASLSYLSKSPGQIDLVTLEGGYELNLGDNFSSGISAAKYFYNPNSTSAKSSLKGEVSASGSYATALLSLNAGIDVSFSSKTDFILIYGISHPFYLGEEGKEWTIEPAILSNAGTQRINAAAKEKIDKTGIKITGADSFVVLDYEFSLPVSFDGNKWGFSLTPTYSIPLNPISIIRKNGKVHEVETLSNAFYVETAVYLKF